MTHIKLNDYQWDTLKELCKKPMEPVYIPYNNFDRRQPNKSKNIMKAIDAYHDFVRTTDPSEELKEEMLNKIKELIKNG